MGHCCAPPNDVFGTRRQLSYLGWFDCVSVGGSEDVSCSNELIAADMEKIPCNKMQLMSGSVSGVNCGQKKIKAVSMKKWQTSISQNFPPNSYEKI